MTEATKFDYTIDENTGLPVLPEGFFWRVEESSFWRLTVLRVSVMQEWFETKKDHVWKTVTVPGTWRNFWMSRKEDHLTTEEQKIRKVHRVRALDAMETDVFPYVENTGLSKKGRTEDMLRDEGFVMAGGPRGWAKALEPTEETVLDIALRVYGDFMEEQEKDAAIKANQQKIQKLTGDYPPKKISLSASDNG